MPISGLGFNGGGFSGGGFGRVPGEPVQFLGDAGGAGAQAKRGASAALIVLVGRERQSLFLPYSIFITQPGNEGPTYI